MLLGQAEAETEAETEAEAVGERGVRIMGMERRSGSDSRGERWSDPGTLREQVRHAWRMNRRLQGSAWAAFLGTLGVCYVAGKAFKH